MQKPVIQLGEHLSSGRAGLDCGAGVGRAQGEVNLHHPTPHLSPPAPFPSPGEDTAQHVCPACLSQACHSTRGGSCGTQGGGKSFTAPRGECSV